MFDNQNLAANPKTICVNPRSSVVKQTYNQSILFILTIHVKTHAANILAFHDFRRKTAAQMSSYRSVVAAPAAHSPLSMVKINPKDQ